MKLVKMGKVFPKMRVTPNVSKLTGLNSRNMGLPSFKPKRKKRSVWRTIKNI